MNGLRFSARMRVRLDRDFQRAREARLRRELGFGTLLVAAAMLATDDSALRARLDAFRAAQTAKVLAQPDPRAALAAGGGA